MRWGGGVGMRVRGGAGWGGESEGRSPFTSMTVAR